MPESRIRISDHSPGAEKKNILNLNQPKQCQKGGLV
jgi:hypothetical protein